MAQQSSPVVLVHGAWHGAWCWERVLPSLESAGIEVHALDLPSCDPSAAPADIHADALALRETLNALDRPGVVVGHSYGGAVISEGAADHPAAGQLVYLAAFMPDAGESIADLLTQVAGPIELTAALRSDTPGRLSLAPESVGPLFYGDCDDASVNWAASRLRSIHNSIAEPVTAAAWRGIPSTYVVCAQDRAVPPDLQRKMGARATDVIEWPTSHSPFASQPHLLADLLVRLASVR